jgi:hypothetical protein
MTELGGMSHPSMMMLIVVASSDATNLKNTTAVVNGDKIVLSGHKWVSLSLPLVLLTTATEENTMRKLAQNKANRLVDLWSRRPPKRNPHSPSRYRPLKPIST